MKLSWGVILSSLQYAAAASKAARVFIYDPEAKASPQQSASVSPETARLILAQRLGLSQFHSIKDANEQVIQQLKTYGGRPQKLFGGNSGADKTDAHVLVWVEDVSERDIRAIIADESAYSAEFTVSNPPAASENDRLVQDLIQQAESLPKKSDPLRSIYRATVDAENAFTAANKAQTYNDYLTVFRGNKLDQESSHDLQTTLVNLLELSARSKKQGWPMTVVLMPPSSPHSKRNAQAYGTYDLPSRVETRREPTEAILSLTIPKSSGEPQTVNPTVPNLENFPTVQQADKSPVLGILPSCFLSQASCQKQTHNCTGHGSCSLIRKGDTGKDQRVKDCYSCTCKPTIVKVEHGMEMARKVTYWGGPACQKRDVSQPFWLFVGVGVVLAGLIGASIGMLFSMGSEELPSVIGAGVSGPVRK